MAEEPTTTKAKPKKGLLIGAVAALVLGAGGFFASSSGVIPPLPFIAGGAPDSYTGLVAKEGDVASFVPIEPIMISMTQTEPMRQLRLETALEVAPGQEEYVTVLMPKILDVMNTYLRAIDLTDIDDPAALLRARMQLLRRVQVTVGGERIKGLLITKFLIS